MVYLWTFFDHLLIVSSKPEKTWSKRYNYGMESRVTFCTQVSDESTGAKKRMSAFVADVTSVLTSKATQTTLRYSVNFISCVQMLAWKRKAKQVGAEDPRKAYT